MRIVRIDFILPQEKDCLEISAGWGAGTELRCFINVDFSNSFV